MIVNNLRSDKIIGIAIGIEIERLIETRSRFNNIYIDNDARNVAQFKED